MLRAMAEGDSNHTAFNTGPLGAQFTFADAPFGDVGGSGDGGSTDGSDGSDSGGEGGDGCSGGK